MPFTPYHFGPSGFIGLALRKWIDIPVFLLANVIIDVEVLFADKWPHHRYWHFHTLLVGAAVGLAGGLAAYPLRNVFKKIMQLMRVPYRPALWKMLISGALGACVHVLIDAVYHYDVQPFWPFYARNPLWRRVADDTVLLLCIISFVPAIALYIVTAVLYTRRNQQKLDCSRK